MLIEVQFLGPLYFDLKTLHKVVLKNGIIVLDILVQVAQHYLDNRARRRTTVNALLYHAEDKPYSGISRMTTVP